MVFSDCEQSLIKGLFTGVRAEFRKFIKESIRPQGWQQWWGWWLKRTITQLSPHGLKGQGEEAVEEPREGNCVESIADRGQGSGLYWGGGWQPTHQGGGD